MSAPLRAMVVDDEPIARRGVQRLLSRDAEVEIVGDAGSGVEAVAQIRRLRPEILVLDVQMPDLDGFGVLQALGSDLPPAVIFVTAFDQHAVRAFEVHALDYVLKPFDDERFEAALRRAKRQAHGARRPARGVRVPGGVRGDDAGGDQVPVEPQLPRAAGAGTPHRVSAPGGPAARAAALTGFRRSRRPPRREWPASTPAVPRSAPGSLPARGRQGTLTMSRARRGRRRTRCAPRLEPHRPLPVRQESSMRLSTSMRTLAIAYATGILAAACGEGDAAGPAARATVSGAVTAATGAVIAGASVTIGSATATTDAGGRFELRGVPAGSATITTSAPRFDTRSESVSLIAGANAHDVVLTPQTLFTYQNLVAYLPPEVAEYRAAIVFLPGLRDPATGNPLDSRGVVRGTAGGTCSIWCSPAELAEVRARALELAGGSVALVGTTTLLDQPADYQTLLQALSQLGAQSLHPELAGIPVLFVGHSQGGCTAYGFSRVHGARVAGFVSMKGGCHDPGPAGAAAGVPGFFLIGGLDAPHRRENITAVFQAGRAAGAPWALATDAYGHGPIADLDLMFNWIDAVLAARLPPIAGAPLRAVAETAGWLGDRSTGAISTYACYDAAPSGASWLPSRQAALDWQRMAGGTAVVGAC